jgi:hypothetical protein
MYHRKDGKVVKESDDLMAATRYAYMMRRYAISKKEAEMSEPIHQPSLTLTASTSDHDRHPPRNLSARAPAGKAPDGVGEGTPAARAEDAGVLPGRDAHPA